MNDLLMEEKEYCDKGNYAHMSQILTYVISNSFAIRRMLVTAGKGVKAYE